MISSALGWDMEPGLSDLDIGVEPCVAGSQTEHIRIQMHRRPVNGSGRVRTSDSAPGRHGSSLAHTAGAGLYRVTCKGIHKMSHLLTTVWIQCRRKSVMLDDTEVGFLPSFSRWR